LTFNGLHGVISQKIELFGTVPVLAATCRTPLTHFRTELGPFRKERNFTDPKGQSIVKATEWNAPLLRVEARTSLTL
jgi:hypothetical protein